MTRYTDDIALINALHRGEAAAFETIYNKYFVTVYYFAKRFVADEAAAQDITTDIFLKVWTKHTDFENLQKLTSFLYVSTRNACINEINAGKRHEQSNKEWYRLLMQEGEDAQARQQLGAAVYDYIYQEIEKLPPQERNVFKLAYIDGFSNEEIAAKLNLGNQVVRNYKTRALKTLRLVVADKDLYNFILLLVCLKHEWAAVN